MNNGDLDILGGAMWRPLRVSGLPIKALVVVLLKIRAIMIKKISQNKLSYEFLSF
tara:strand:+ start:1132 stop:1296 length:165 start_codon:yes stop_codon:yes gene_type:complete